jgi:hypothetical protein
MNIFGAAVLLFCFPIVCGAQSISVKSGDHSGFSRFVLTVPQPENWNVKAARNLVTVEGFSRRLEFDVSEVFTRISKARVSNVRVTDSRDGLILELNCKCIVESSTYKDRYLVVDIHDPPPNTAFSEIPIEQNKYRFSDALLGPSWKQLGGLTSRLKSGDVQRAATSGTSSDTSVTMGLGLVRPSRPNNRSERQEAQSLTENITDLFQTGIGSDVGYEELLVENLTRAAELGAVNLVRPTT